MIEHNIKKENMIFIDPWIEWANLEKIDNEYVIYDQIQALPSKTFNPTKQYIYVATYNGDGGLYQCGDSITIQTANHIAYRNINIPNNVLAFSTNCNMKHKNVIPLPYGVICDMNTGADKDTLCYTRFSTWTFPEQRNRIRQVCVSKDYITCDFSNSPAECDHDRFLVYRERLGRSKFSICPPGNGPDTYRVWECLYANVIPIVLDTQIYRNFEQDLPILIVSDFNNISEELLNEKYEEFSNKEWDYSKIKLSYYKDKIKDAFANLRNETVRD